MDALMQRYMGAVVRSTDAEGCGRTSVYVVELPGAERVVLQRVRSHT